MNILHIGTEDAVKLQLKSLYREYGYDEYRLSGFEEYAFYAENENFLNSKDVIAVNAGGKLLALRSDVTLSIAKNIDIDSACTGVHKLFYDEKVFRKGHGGSINEISQIGIEIMGELDKISNCELAQLMKDTLSRAAGNRFVVDISHMGIIVKALKMLSLDKKEEHAALECLRSKNSHDFLRLMNETGKTSRQYNAFLTLITLPSDGKEAMDALRKIEGLDISKEIQETEEFLTCAQDFMQVDFSIVGDYSYYNGVIFKGYVQGVPKAVLSGGRYDRLLEKFGKRAQAIGFALYLGELDLRSAEDLSDPEYVIQYSKEDDATAEAVQAKAAVLRAEGSTVLVSRCLPADFTGTVIRAEELI